mgnify:CR=1 FL=1
MQENVLITKSKENVISLYMTKVYFLLAISFIPTIVTIFFLKDKINYFKEAHPTSLLLLGCLAVILCFVLIYLIKIFNDSNLSYLFLMLFTALNGAIMTPVIGMYLKSSAGTEILFQAMTLTFIVFIGMSLLSIFVKNVSFLGQFLFVGLISLIVVSIFNLFFQSTLLQSVLSGVGAILFSLFILYDTKNASENTNISPVVPVLQLYLDIVNLFLSILDLIKR